MTGSRKILEAFDATMNTKVWAVDAEIMSDSGEQLDVMAVANAQVEYERNPSDRVAAQYRGEEDGYAFDDITFTEIEVFGDAGQTSYKSSDDPEFLARLGVNGLKELESRAKASF